MTNSMRNGYIVSAIFDLGKISDTKERERSSILIHGMVMEGYIHRLIKNGKICDMTAFDIWMSLCRHILVYFNGDHDDVFIKKAALDCVNELLALNQQLQMKGL